MEFILFLFAEGKLQFKTNTSGSQLYGDELDLSPGSSDLTTSPAAFTTFGDEGTSCLSSASLTTSGLHLLEDAAIPHPPDIGGLHMPRQLSTTSPSPSYAQSPMSSVSSSSSNFDSGRSSGNYNTQEKKHRSKGSKKSSKPVQKGQRLFKFHEYKYPSKLAQQQSIVSDTSSKSNSNVSDVDANPTGDHPYHVILQQQQLLLQWQLELQQKTLMQQQVADDQPQESIPSLGAAVTSPKVQCVQPSLQVSSSSLTQKSVQLINNGMLTASCALPVNTVAPLMLKPTSTVSLPSVGNVLPGYKPTVVLPSIQLPTVAPVSSSTPKQQVAKASNDGKVTKLEDLKVSQLRAELKKRKLPVSGSKPHLLERLKPYADIIVQSWADGSAVDAEANNEQVQSGILQHDDMSRMAIETDLMLPMSPGAEHDNSGNDATSISPLKQYEGESSGIRKNATVNGITPMLIDQMSRPPSAAPMEVDVSNLHVQQNANLQASNTFKDLKSLMSQSTMGTTSIASVLPVTSQTQSQNMLAGGSFTLGVNPLMWQQATPLMGMSPMQMFTPTPVLMPSLQQAGLIQQQQFMQLMADSRNWLPMQQMIQQQMMICSQGIQQANARVQQQQAALQALQQQQQLASSQQKINPSGDSVISTDKSKIPQTATSVNLSASWPSSSNTPTKSLSNEEMLLLQQQQQIQQLYSALHQSQQRLAEAEQQAEQQTKYWTLLQHQFMMMMMAYQHHLGSSNKTLQTGQAEESSPVKAAASVVSVSNPPSQILPSISILQQDLKSGLKITPPSASAFVFPSANNTQSATSVNEMGESKFVFTSPLTGNFSSANISTSGCESLSDIK